MFRLMMLLFAFVWGAMLDTAGGGSGGGSGEGSGGEGGSGGDGSLTLTEAELTQRTSKAAEDKVSELAGVLGVDLSNPADVKAMIEAGRKAQNDSGSGDKGGSGEAGGDGLDALLDTLENINKRIEGIEGKETEREKASAERTRNEKIVEALKGANVRDDQLENAARYAGTFELSVNDKGELIGQQDAIEGVKKAMPHAFRGEGDDGKAADASGRERTERKPKTLSEALTAHYSKS